MTNDENYRIASPYKTRTRIWALLTIASMLLGIGTGWVLVRLLSAQDDQWFLASFAASAILILAAVIMERSRTRVKRRQKETLRQGIDLKHLQKSLISYGYQPPVIETLGLRTQLIKVSRRNEIPNDAPLVIIEHFDGADMLVRCEGIGKDYILQKNTLVRIDFATHDLNRQIVFLPIEDSLEPTGYVLVHCIMNE